MAAAAENKFNAVVNIIEEETKNVFILFDKSIQDGFTVAHHEIDRDYVLSLDHLLLPKKLHKDSLKILQKLQKTRAECQYGDTYLGDLIFSSVMQPEVRKCVTALKKQEYGKALASLIGMFFVFSFNDEGWIRDNECWNEKSFAKFFREYSLCWKIMLGGHSSDSGMVYQAGLPDDYKDTLIRVLDLQQDETNLALAGVRDCFDESQSEMSPLVDIFPLPEVPLSINSLPGRKPQQITGKRSQKPKPKTKKPRKPTHFWFHKDDSAAYRNQIINRQMAEWREEVKKWEAENKENQKAQASKKQSGQSSSKNNAPKKPRPSTKSETGTAAGSSTATKGILKRKAETRSLNSTTSKKLKEMQEDENEAGSSKSEEMIRNSTTVSRSGRKCMPVNRYV